MSSTSYPYWIHHQLLTFHFVDLVVHPSLTSADAYISRTQGLQLKLSLFLW